ncbi:MAG: hypothetical protein K5848_08660 [Lachnospiraceae bacterium]|nr:hypothetical protein [Lachnospiraceae bacterium]
MKNKMKKKISLTVICSMICSLLQINKGTALAGENNNTVSEKEVAVTYDSDTWGGAYVFNDEACLIHLCLYLSVIIQDVRHVSLWVIKITRNNKFKGQFTHAVLFSFVFLFPRFALLLLLCYNLERFLTRRKITGNEWKVRQNG